MSELQVALATGLFIIALINLVIVLVEKLSKK